MHVLANDVLLLRVTRHKRQVISTTRHQTSVSLGTRLATHHADEALVSVARRRPRRRRQGAHLLL